LNKKILASSKTYDDRKTRSMHVTAMDGEGIHPYTEQEITNNSNLVSPPKLALKKLNNKPLKLKELKRYVSVEPLKRSKIVEQESDELQLSKRLYRKLNEKRPSGFKNRS